MAITSRVTLKSAYETGDKPQGSDYVNWIDSFLHLTDTSAQAISSKVNFNASVQFQTLKALDISVSGVGASLVSCGRLVASSVSARITVTDTLKVSGSAVFNTVSANSIWTNRLEAVSAVFTSAKIDVLHVSGSAVFDTVSANTIWADDLIVVSGIFTSVSAETMHVDDLIVVSANFTDAFLLNDARIRVTAAIPTVGQHAQGDLAFNSSPDAGGTVGWVNVVAGAPGTWKEFGSIEA